MRAFRKFVPLEDGGTKILAEHFFKGPVSLETKYPYEDCQAGLWKWNNGAFVQDAFPFMSDDEREFLLSGLTGDQFDELFPDE